MSLAQIATNVSAMQALKYPKQLVYVAHIKSSPIVLHLIDAFAPLSPAADHDAWLRLLGAVLQCVANQIAPDLAHDGLVASARGQIIDVYHRLGTAIDG